MERAGRGQAGGKKYLKTPQATGLGGLQEVSGFTAHLRMENEMETGGT